MTTYFLSDVHLGLASPAKEKEKENRLLSFLEQVRRTGEALYIVGDLFDFWFDYATVVPRGFHRTLTALQALTDNRIPVHFLAGNHDYWIGDFFQKELNVQIHYTPFETSIHGKRVYMHHGDGLAQKDVGYRLIKPILRNRLAIAAYRWLHPDIGVRLARGSSKSSREYTSAKDYGEEEAMVNHADRLIGSGIDIVVMGHRHQPELRPVGNGLYVNLGDWITHNTYGSLNSFGMRLETWKGTQEEFNGR
jgi:UDP-2,3-diacylglucosamine hydrolase